MGRCPPLRPRRSSVAPAPREKPLEETRITGGSMSIRIADRIDRWPWVKSIALFGLLTFAAAMTMTGALTALAVAGRWMPAPADAWLVDRMLRALDVATDAALWCMAAGALGIVGKRATTTPGIVEAETRVEAKRIESAAIRDILTLKVGAAGAESPRDALSEVGD